MRFVRARTRGLCWVVVAAVAGSRVAAERVGVRRVFATGRALSLVGVSGRRERRSRGVGRLGRVSPLLGCLRAGRVEYV